VLDREDRAVACGGQDIAMLERLDAGIVDFVDTAAGRIVAEQRNDGRTDPVVDHGPVDGRHHQKPLDQGGSRPRQKGVVIGHAALRIGGDLPGRKEVADVAELRRLLDPLEIVVDHASPPQPDGSTLEGERLSYPFRQASDTAHNRDREFPRRSVRIPLP